MKSSRHLKRIWLCAGGIGCVLLLSSCDWFRARNHCEAFRTSPASGAAALKDSMVSVNYTTKSLNRCQLVLEEDSSRTTVLTQMVEASEWANPRLKEGNDDYVSGYMAAMPTGGLKPGTKYVIKLKDTYENKDRQQKVVASFTVSSDADFRGEVVSADEVPTALVGETSSATPKSTFTPSDLKTIVGSDGSVSPGAFRSAISEFVSDAQLDGWVRQEKANYPESTLKDLSTVGFFSVNVRRLVYYSVDGKGQKTKLSGLLVYPVSTSSILIDYTKTPVVILQHPTLDAEQFPPSTGGPEFVGFASLVATRGYITFLPDLIGFSPGKEAGALPSDAFLVAQDTGTATRDMLLATRNFISTQFKKDISANKVNLAGFSQGGASVFAAAPYLKSIGSDIVKLYALAGPYNLSDMIQANIKGVAGDPYLASDKEDIPYFLQRVFNSFRGFMNYSFKDSDFFTVDKTGVATALVPGFVSSYTSRSKEYAELDARAGAGSFAGAALRTYSYGLNQSAEIGLAHKENDDVVPFQNTVALKASLSAAGYSGVKDLSCALSPSFLSPHVACLFTFFEQFLSSLPIIPGGTTTSTTSSTTPPAPAVVDAVSGDLKAPDPSVVQVG